MLDMVVMLLAGFSVFSSLLLLLAYFYVYSFESHTLLAKAACAALLTGLMAAQVLQADFLVHGGALLSTRSFATLLLVIPPAFYFFSREVLQFQPALSWRALLHGLPLALSPFLDVAWLVPLAFLIGTAYACWLTVQVARLRAGHRRGKLELAFWVVFLLMAVAMLAVVFARQWIPERAVVMSYASLIGIALLAVMYTLLKSPNLVSDTVEAVRARYAASTLGSVDCDALAARLEALMLHDKLYQNEALNVAMVAEQLGIGAHQLSELINSRLGVSFSRYIRERRVAAASRMLIDEPTASVLSIGLSVGFTSQSNFYAAFREITGVTPGQFRKQSDHT